MNAGDDSTLELGRRGLAQSLKRVPGGAVGLDRSPALLTAEEVLAEAPLLFRGELAGEEGNQALFRARHGLCPPLPAKPELVRGKGRLLFPLFRSGVGHERVLTSFRTGITGAGGLPKVLSRAPCGPSKAAGAQLFMKTSLVNLPLRSPGP